MNKKKNTNSKLPPRDSWIELASGNTVKIDNEFAILWNEQTHKFRALRGEVLAHTFNIEYLIDQAIGLAFINPKENEKESNLFDEIFLKGSNIPLRKKTDILRKLHPEILVINENIDLNFLKKIDKVRDIRNRFAHYPIVFEPSIKDNVRNIIPKLCCRDKTIVLDKTTLDSYWKVTKEVMIQMENLVKIMSK
jgi:hypothetical protein